MAVELLGEDIVGVDIVGADIYGDNEVVGEDVLGYDIIGEDILGEDMLGADWRQVAAMTANPAGAGYAALQAYKRRKAAQRAYRAKGAPMLIRKAPPLINKVPGVSAPSQVKIPLGFGAALLNANALANGSSVSTNATATPQVPVRGGRLVLNRFDSGTSACPILITNVQVGQQSIFASAQGVPVEAFGPTATDTVLTIPAAQPGVIITASYTLTNNTGAALVGTAAATITGVLICDSIAG